MTTGLFSLLLLITLAHTATLEEQRLAAAEVWTLRSKNTAAMNLAFSDAYTTPEVAHVIRDVGDYGPRDVALEYDNLVLDLAIFLGYDPYVLTAHWDPATTRWVGPDTLRVDWTLDLKVGFDPVAQVYSVDGKGFRMTEFIVFKPGTALINLGYTIQDPAAIAAIATQDAVSPNSYICEGVIFPACNGSAQLGYRPYLPDTGFTTVQECITFLDSLPENNPCPFIRRSNTPDCRLLHGFSSFLLPEYHCSHVKPGSPKCVDSCLPACSSCHPDAECVAIFPTLYTPEFECKCKNGFIGNGTSCVAKPCAYGQCPSQWGTYECSTGNCKCREGFQSNPQNTTNLCTCPDGGEIITSSAGATCVPVGRCINQQWQCSHQAYNQVKCLDVGNNITNFKACICNHGFEGGWEYPCSCPAGKQIWWSASVEGEVCLDSTECTAAFHCPFPKSCQLNSTSLIGKCV